MFSRTFSALAASSLLAACGGESPPPPGETVECALGAGAALSDVCTLEVVSGGAEIVIHHPDGGFRRLARDLATGTLTPRDGADPLVQEAGADSALAFAIGADRYRIPLRLLAPPPR